MASLNYKKKIYSLLGLWLLACVLLFGYFFGLLDKSSRAAAEKLALRKAELGELVQEQQTADLGKKDLAKLAGLPIPEDSLFSRDTKVVREIETLEALAKNTGVSLELAVAGTAGSAQKAKTKSELLLIPYTVSLNGAFEGAVAFLDGMEHLPFVTQIEQVSARAQKNSAVKVFLSAVFYLKK